MDLKDVSAADLVQALFKAATANQANSPPVTVPAASPPPAAPAQPAAQIVQSVEPSPQARMLAHEKAARFIAVDKHLRQLRKEKETLGADLYALIPLVAEDRATITLSDGSSVTIGQKTEKRATKTSIFQYFATQGLKEKAESYWNSLKGNLKKCLCVHHTGDAEEPESDED